jgi:plastocyanin
VKRAAAPVAVLALGAALVSLPASVAGAGSTRTVTIGDNFYSPAKLTVKVGTTVRWKWPDDTGDTHDVKLKSGPKGFKKFHSEEAGSAYSFKRTLTKPGTYKIICTLHEEMRETITVKR